jgi:CRISPR-associated protein Csy3
MSKLLLPSVLAFDRKLEPSDALMHSGNWSEINNPSAWQPIKLFERRNRAVKSNFKPEVLENEEELQKQIAQPNLAWGDDAALSHEHDTLKISYTLRVVGGLSKPSICNKKEFQDKFSEKIGEHIQSSIDELAKRYAYNIANGRFLWRNRIGAQAIKVTVNHSSLNAPLVFDAYKFSLKQTTTEDEAVQKLAEFFKAGLKGKESTLLTINAFVHIGAGQRVWPSQEMVLIKGEKSRHLFSLNGIAAMHCEKIGNALRTIDDWYPEYANTETPIAIEAYGSVTQRAIAYRSSKNDFKILLLRWLNAQDISANDKNFVIAMIIRGGVFGEEDKKSNNDE